MIKLWRTRLRQHVQEQQKYLRLVFNDHFVLILLILFALSGINYLYRMFMYFIWFL